MLDNGASMAREPTSNAAKWIRVGVTPIRSAMLVAGLGVVDEADHNENETDQRRRGCADERIEVAPLRHDVVQGPPPILDATMTA